MESILKKTILVMALLVMALSLVFLTACSTKIVETTCDADSVYIDEMIVDPNEQGDAIYANGRMQKLIKIYYKAYSDEFQVCPITL